MSIFSIWHSLKIRKEKETTNTHWQPSNKPVDKEAVEKSLKEAYNKAKKGPQ